MKNVNIENTVLPIVDNIHIINTSTYDPYRNLNL